MAKTTTTADLVYDPEQIDLPREVDQTLDLKLTGKPAVETLAQALKDAAFDFDPDDHITVATAEGLEITDDDAYTRGFELLSELTDLNDRITTWYARFDKPLNFLIGVVRSCKGPQTKQVEGVKKALSGRLGLYKAQKEEAARKQREAEQRQRDEDARAAQEAKAAALQRVAEQEPDPAMAASIAAEAQQVAASVTFISGPPVEARPAVPSVPGGFVRTTYKCEFVDVKELLRAYLDGKCVLDEEAIKAGLQSFMDTQARALENRLGQAYPGTRAVPSYGATQRRK